MSFKVIGIGEVLWDMLPSGPQMGGAPANFAYHAHSLGASASVISRVGNDAPGRSICERFRELGLSAQTLQLDDQFPTGSVDVTLNGDGVPQYVIHRDVAWDNLEATQESVRIASVADAICFGTLAQRGKASREAIQLMVKATPPKALRVFDINLRQNFYTPGVIEESLLIANVLKLNDAELPVLADMFGLSGLPGKQIEQLARRFELPFIALTCGAEGSLIFKDGVWSRQLPSRIKVLDTVGAGDSFTAAMVMGLLLNMPLEEMHAAAAEVARHVCSCVGATPKLPHSLADKFAIRQPTLPSIIGNVIPAK